MWTAIIVLILVLAGGGYYLWTKYRVIGGLQHLSSVKSGTLKTTAIGGRSGFEYESTSGYYHIVYQSEDDLVLDFDIKGTKDTLTEYQRAILDSISFSNISYKAN